MWTNQQFEQLNRGLWEIILDQDPSSSSSSLVTWKIEVPMNLTAKIWGTWTIHVVRVSYMNVHVRFQGIPIKLTWSDLTPRWSFNISSFWMIAMAPGFSKIFQLAMFYLCYIIPTNAYNITIKSPIKSHNTPPLDPIFNHNKIMKNPINPTTIRSHKITIKSINWQVGSIQLPFEVMMTSVAPSTRHQEPFRGSTLQFRIAFVSPDITTTVAPLKELRWPCPPVVSLKILDSVILMIFPCSPNNIFPKLYSHWYSHRDTLVGGIPTPLKNMTSSVGMMISPNIWKVIKFMFQTTNQIYCWWHPYDIAIIYIYIYIMQLLYITSIYYHFFLLKYSKPPTSIINNQWYPHLRKPPPKH